MPQPPVQHLGKSTSNSEAVLYPLVKQRLAREQHPGWDTECLRRQESIHGGNWESSKGRFQKRDASDEKARQDEASSSPRGARIPQIKRHISVPLGSFQARAAVNSTDMRCNGRTDLCDLRYNQVTYPGTHNSGAYDLQYDCGLSTETCLKSTTVCTEQAQNCTKGWETRCTKMTNTCENSLPKWLHWLCGAFTSVCESTEQFCLGWEQICTSSIEVCTLWGSACLQLIPDWAVPCLWENQPGHPISQQLTDGIRFLDLGTCLTKNNTELVLCHGNGALRALGHPLDSILSQILEFALANPYEVITVEFNQYDGDVALISQMIVSKILKYFTLPTGELMFWSRKDVSEPWPTLKDMILANKRIMLFFGDTYWSIPDPKPGWANQKDVWKKDGFHYTSQDSQPAQLNQSYYDWCTQGPPNDGSFLQWQQIDINMAILEEDIRSSLQKGQIPQLCIGPLAKETNSAFLDALADYCYSRWPYWFRVRVNDYWEGNLFKVTNLFNDRNVARIKAGDTLTPF